MNHRSLAILLVAAVLIAVAIAAFVVPRHKHPAASRATCWARPGVIGYAGPGKYVPVYTPNGNRHGPGRDIGECNA
jgi:hypothetical protein